jgi:uncharacterized zinc-type alcohol dehydrogenase-like protein
MSDSTVSGYAAMAKGQSLELFTYESPELGEYDVRVSVTHCGLCYSDIQAIDDYYGVVTYPFVPGHEIVGRVVAAGKNPAGLKVGDRVGIGWQGRSCGNCEWCSAGEEQLCMDIVKAGTWFPYGGFASSVVVDSRFTYSLPNSLPSETAAVLLCGGISVYSPLKLHVKQKTQSICIIGIGGLGHLAIQFAHALGYNVTVISTSAEKKGEAITYGADNFIVSNDVMSLSRLEFSFDMILCTAHGELKWEPLLSILKKRGEILLVGFPEMVFNSTDLVVHELSITGSFLGNRAMMREMLLFAQSHNIKPRIELMPMSQINRAIEKLKQNKARYRIVLVNDILS